MISRTLYLVSLFSFLIFLGLDWLRPGFVAFVFSPHIFLFLAFVSGAVWAQKGRVEKVTPLGRIVRMMLIVLLSFSFATLAWQNGRALNDWRLLITLAAAMTPVFVAQALLTDK